MNLCLQAAQAAPANRGLPSLIGAPSPVTQPCTPPWLPVFPAQRLLCICKIQIKTQGGDDDTRVRFKMAALLSRADISLGAQGVLRATDAELTASAIIGGGGGWKLVPPPQNDAMA